MGIGVLYDVYEVFCEKFFEEKFDVFFLSVVYEGCFGEVVVENNDDLFLWFCVGGV